MCALTSPILQVTKLRPGRLSYLPSSPNRVKQSGGLNQSTKASFRVYPLIRCVSDSQPWMYNRSPWESFKITLMSGTHPLRYWCSCCRLGSGILFQALRCVWYPVKDEKRSPWLLNSSLGNVLYLCMLQSYSLLEYYTSPPLIFPITVPIAFLSPQADREPLEGEASWSPLCDQFPELFRQGP